MVEKWAVALCLRRERDETRNNLGGYAADNAEVYADCSNRRAAFVSRQGDGLAVLQCVGANARGTLRDQVAR